MTARPLFLALVGLAFLATPSFGQQTQITIGEGIFPESIASTDDGSLLIGSVAKSTVYRVAPGATTAQPWITKGLGSLVLGVFAVGDTAYVCSNGPNGSGDATLKTFDIATGSETGSYTFPHEGVPFCTDIAVSPDGSVYVTNLTGPGIPGQLWKLEGGQLKLLLSDAKLGGIDGIAFIGDTLYVTDLFAGALLRVNLDQNPVTTTALALSQPLGGPDGMRTTYDDKGLLIAEANANVSEIASGFAGPNGIAQVGSNAYVVEGNFTAMNGSSDPGQFVVKVLPLP